MKAQQGSDFALVYRQIVPAALGVEADLTASLTAGEGAALEQILAKLERRLQADVPAAD